jgi:hypothetical protein
VVSLARKYWRMGIAFKKILFYKKSLLCCYA